jgi:hypothetical protein
MRGRGTGGRTDAAEAVVGEYFSLAGLDFGWEEFRAGISPKQCLGASVSVDGDEGGDGYSPLGDFELVLGGNDDWHDGGGDDDSYHRVGDKTGNQKNRPISGLKSKRTGNRVLAGGPILARRHRGRGRGRRSNCGSGLCAVLVGGPHGGWCWEIIEIWRTEIGGRDRSRTRGIFPLAK